MAAPLVGSLYAVGLLSFTRLLTIFEHDSDEGGNLMKSRLVSEGFRLYSEIWSDQPPFFTYLLSGWQALFGSSVESARLLVLLFSCCLVALVYRALQQRFGHVAACIGVIFLVSSARFLQLSLSVMIGLPCMTLVMFSFFCLLHWADRRKAVWLAASAAALATALSIKLFVAFLGPLLGLWMMAESRQLPLRNCILPPLGWLSGQWAIAAAVIWLTAGPLFFQQLVEPHYAAFLNIPLSGWERLPILIRRDWHLHLLAGLGCFQMLRHWPGNRLLRGAFIWYAAGIVVLFFHAPVWYHHSMLITIPASLLGGAGTVLSWRDAPQSRMNPILVRLMNWLGMAARPASALILAALALWIVQGKRSFASWRWDSMSSDWRVVETLKSQPGNGWVVTALPIQAYRAGMLVPAELTVTSRKRFASGELDADEILRIIARYRPSHVVLAPPLWPDKVFRHLKAMLPAEYQLLAEDSERVIYRIRRDPETGNLRNFLLSR